ncbi:MAG: hypothetical protein HYX24_03930 [Candidatus Aenigmarchaeota archaeon]|nr:hypothetical protein [Candidatus Aenigmarchaeota archaeon]
MKTRGLSGKEMELVSWLELEGKRFFTRSDARRFFKNINEMNVYINRLKGKGRIVKLNRKKYYLVPIQAFRGHWAEHPFIVVDEIFNGKGYFIGGKAAAHYWGLIEQIPHEIDAYSTGRQGKRTVFSFAIRYRRTSKSNMRGFVRRKIKGHCFLIANKRRSVEWE